MGKKKEAPTAGLLELRRTPESPAVLVGRNNLQNERITFSLARAHEVWLHARGVAGAHVLLRLVSGFLLLLPSCRGRGGDVVGRTRGGGGRKGHDMEPLIKLVFQSRPHAIIFLADTRHDIDAALRQTVPPS